MVAREFSGGSSPTKLPAGFEALAGPLRTSVKMHCYRMLGSLHEAEDAVQDAYLRAWRAFDTFDGRSSFKGWLYRIATNACLDAIAKRKRISRILPDQLGPATIEMPNGIADRDVAWLEPYPDREFESIADETPGPEALYSMHQSVQLAFVAVLQVLPPRQRAVILLCDVLGWSAAETATLLGSSLASVNSALQRSRKTLSEKYPEGQTASPKQLDPVGQELLDRYMRSWERADVDELVALLKEDAIYTMPPLPQWYLGPTDIGRFFGWAWGFYDGFMLRPIGANGQPGFAAYSRRAPDEPWKAHSLHVLSVDHAGISRITVFYGSDAPRLFETFGLPLIA